VVRHCCAIIHALAPHLRAASAAGAAPPSFLASACGAGQGALMRGVCQLLAQVLVTRALGTRNWCVRYGCTCVSLARCKQGKRSR